MWATGDAAFCLVVSSGPIEKKGGLYTLKRTEKEQVVEELHDKFTRAKAAVLADFRGLDTTAICALRVKLKKSKAELRVVKNTLVRRASEGTSISVMSDYFTGPSAVAYSYDDPVAPAKVLTEFADANPRLTIRAGMVEGHLIDPAGVKALAKLPSREQLIGQLLSVFNGPARSMVTVLSGVQRGIVTVLDAIRKQKEGVA